MSEFRKFREHLLIAEREINLIRQRLEDSTVTINGEGVIQPMDSQNLITLMNDDEWDFDNNRRGKIGGDVKLLSEALQMLTKGGDKVRLGPFETAERARGIQSQIGNIVYDTLKWQREPNGTNKGAAPYESHIKPSQPLYLYIRRNYAP